MIWTLIGLLLIIGIATEVLIRWRIVLLDNGYTIAGNGWINRTVRKRYAEFIIKNGTRADRDASEALKSRLNKEAAAEKAKGTYPRLQEQLRLYESGTISADDYRAAIIDLRDEVREKMAELRASRRNYDEETFDDLMDTLNDDLDDIRHHLNDLTSAGGDR